MHKKSEMAFGEKNRFAYAAIRIVKEYILDSKEPIQNPIIFIGAEKALRYRIFWSAFTKEFNRDHKDIYIYNSCQNITLEKIQTRRLVIFESMELLNDDSELQTKIKDLFEFCFREKIQIVCCSDIALDDLNIDDCLKKHLKDGLLIKIER